MSQTVFPDTSNNFISILVVFGDLPEKSKKSCGDESFEIVQYHQWTDLRLKTQCQTKLLAPQL